MTRDEQEAESRKYGPGIKMILPLSSGAYAVFDHKRQLQEIVTELPTWFPFTAPPAPKPVPGRAELDAFLKEIDLDF